MRGRIADPDHLVRLAEHDAHAASLHFAESFVAAAPSALDWPDMLADDLRRLDPFALAIWAEERAFAPRRSAAVSGPHMAARPNPIAPTSARAPLAAVRLGGEAFADIAHRLHFTDQAHMTRAVAGLTGAPPGWWRRRQMDTRQR